MLKGMTPLQPGEPAALDLGAFTLPSRPFLWESFAPQAIFGRSYAAEPDVLIEQLQKDEAVIEVDTLLLTVPNQLGVAYNAHVIESILTHVAPALGWR